MRLLFTTGFLILLITPCFVHGQEVNFRESSRYIFGTHIERSASISLGDIDDDGDVDAVIANGRHWPGQNRIFINNGRGVFTVSLNRLFMDSVGQ